MVYNNISLITSSILLFQRAHESWDLPEPPHMVTFAKKMHIGGIYGMKGIFPKEVCISLSCYYHIRCIPAI